jgi:hypothetical protein
MVAAAVVVVAAGGCKPKATASECDQLLERYARLVVTEKHPDASADDIIVEQRREKDEARGDDAFKNCSSEVSREELRCAMSALTADAFEKCLE